LGFGHSESSISADKGGTVLRTAVLGKSAGVAILPSLVIIAPL